MDWSYSKLLLGTIGAYLAYKVLRLFVDSVMLLLRTRRRYHDIPAYPRHWLLGNLVQIGEKINPNDTRHPDYGMMEIWEELGRPAGFLLDLAPVDKSILVIADPVIAEEIAQPSNINKYSCLKSDTVWALWRLMGAESMVLMEGEVWRNLRKRFSKAFSPTHLHSLSPLLVSKTRIFTDKLRSVAETGETFCLQDYSQDLTTDVITTIAVEHDFGAQSVPDGQGPKSRFGFLTACRKLPGTAYKSGQGINLLYLLNPIRPVKAWLYNRIQNRTLEAIILASMKVDQATSDRKSAKTIVQLALSGLTPTPALVANTRDQIKTFIFAGQDTTATTIQWMCYEMYQAAHHPTHARFLARLRAEHDAVFGSIAFSSVFDTLANPKSAEQILGDKLPYTLAFIKETLRLHPPAGSARMCPFEPTHEPPFTVTIDGKETRIDGLRMYIAHWLIHRNPKVWGADATEFNPDRWMDEEYMRKLPPGAWRPFERGPRNCIGQELALMELKVVLCAIARGFVFEKIGQTGRDGEKEVYNLHEVTSVPSDGMMMKVTLRAEGK